MSIVISLSRQPVPLERHAGSIAQEVHRSQQVNFPACILSTHSLTFTFFKFSNIKAFNFSSSCNCSSNSAIQLVCSFHFPIRTSLYTHQTQKPGCADSRLFQPVSFARQRLEPDHSPLWEIDRSLSVLP